MSNQPYRNMKTLIIVALVVAMAACTASQEPSGTKDILLEQLKNSYDNPNWFVPLKNAIAGVTADQANWKDSTGNHSIGELVSHLIFWNEGNLLSFHGKERRKFSGDNRETFVRFTSLGWEQSKAKLDSIQLAWNEAVENATSEQLKDFDSEIGNIASHNAYHTGQIIYIRKMKGWWDDAKGVK